MPVKLDQGDRNIFLVAGGMFLVLLVAAIVFSPGGEREGEVPSTYSASSKGAKAAYLLLQEMHRDVHRWEESPLALRAGPEPVTYVLTEPSQMPTSEERAALREFVRSGGRLVATGVFAATLLPENASSMDGIPDLVSWRKFRALTPSELTRAPEITVTSSSYWHADQGPYVPLYGDSADHAVVISYSYGKGEVIWWAGPTPLSNAGIREPGNLELLLGSVGEANRKILWDEYFHGHKSGSAASVLSAPGRWLVLQLAIMAAAVLVTFSRRSGPIRMPRAESRLSPLEFVDTLGGLYERAGATPVAVEVSYARFRSLVTRRFGLPANATIAELQNVVQAHLGQTDEGLSTTLADCDAARLRPDLSSAEALRLVQALHKLTQKLQLIRAPEKE